MGFSTFLTRGLLVWHSLPGLRIRPFSMLVLPFNLSPAYALFFLRVAGKQDHFSAARIYIGNQEPQILFRHIPLFLALKGYRQYHNSQLSLSSYCLELLCDVILLWQAQVLYRSVGSYIWKVWVTRACNFIINSVNCMEPSISTDTTKKNSTKIIYFSFLCYSEGLHTSSY